MNPWVFLVLAMVFFSVLMLGAAVIYFLKGREDEEIERKRERLGVMQIEDPDEALSSLIRDQAADGIMEYLGQTGEQMQENVRASGLNLTVRDVLLQCAMVGGLAMLVGVGVGGPRMVFLGLVGFLPYQRVKMAAASRAKTMLAQLPDSLEMMGRAMQAGTGLSECFKLVSDEMAEPVGPEFGRVYDEVRFGKDWRDALNNLLDRNPALFDLRLFVSSLILQRETGGNMIETVNRIAKLIRQRSVFDAKVKAMTSEARASGFILAVMPLGVAVLVLVSNPSYLTPLWDTQIGQVALVYCIASYIFGIFIMQNQSKVEV